jgi:hypothetical protein
VSGDAERPRRRRWLVAGGVLGLVLSPAAAPYRQAIAARALRLRRPGADPVAPFREAPCYEREGAQEGKAVASGEALP